MDFVDLKAQYRALKTEIDARIQRVLDHGQYIMGPEVRELEEALAARTGAKHCITCASGTEALLMSLMALEIKPGDEVITTPFTFAATAEVIVLLGARPVFVDIEPGTCLIDATQIEAAITEKTRAIMPVSLYGQPCDMDAINAIAAKHGDIPVIEDAAQSFGAKYRGTSGIERQSCNLSTIGCTSFFPSKPLGCYGDGGAAFTNDDEIAKVLRQIRIHGQEGRYHHVRVGVGGRMDTIQCAVVLAKLQRFDWEIEQREAIAQRYLSELHSRIGIRLPTVAADRSSVWAQFTLQIDDRTAVQERLRKAGVPTAVHYPRPLNEQPAFAQLCCAECTPRSSGAAAKVLSLPMSADLSDVDQQAVVTALVAA
ncbi:MAG: DegT/DnrJ/EryC1/StrS family aminotransferase [Betaproteobacteria bacterium]|jgi:UDP-2-acetamido-2-deoxy-ribo-hexuluronate aminotransferase